MPVERANTVALKRELGLLDLVCIASGAAISSGLFVLPAILYTDFRLGPAFIWCYVLAAVLQAPTVLSRAELATAIPRSGGTYFLLARSSGLAMGMVGGIAAWASLAFKTGFALLGMSLFAQLLWPGMSEVQVRWLAIGLALGFAGLNVLGVKHAGRLQVFMVLALLTILAAYVLSGLGKVSRANLAAGQSPAFADLLSGTGAVFLSFVGLTKLAEVGEEVRRPGRDQALGMYISWAIVAALYVGAVFVTAGILSPEAFEGSRTPFSAGGEVLWGQAGFVLLTFAGLLAVITTGNAGLLAASRTPMAMSRDGLLPAVLGRVHSRRGTPHWAICLTAAFIVAVLFLPVDIFIKSAAAMNIILFIMEMLALVILRESRLATYQPVFRSPFYPWLQIAGILVYVLLLVELGSLPLLVSAAILGGAAAWYVYGVRTRVVQESALTHLARRIASASLGGQDLEAELAQIVRERDRAHEDDFDRLVTRSAVLDLPGPLTRDELFSRIAERLAENLGMSAAEIRRLLDEREEAGSTVVRPGLAIPHLVAPGERLFGLVMVRCRGGVTFAEGEPPVHTAFVLVGSADERERHLQALAALAEIAHDPAFERRWLAARGEAHLRRVVLRSKRRREIIVP